MHVAVAVRSRLGLTRGARGEGQQGDVVGGSGAGCKVAAVLGAQRAQVLRVIRCVVAQHGLQHSVLRLRLCQFIQQFGIANGQRGLGSVDDVAKFLRAQQWHGGDCHQACFDDGQPSQRQANGVAPAQQHAVAGYQAVFLREELGNAVDTLACLGVSEHHFG
jgi:hypothetical protein